MAKWGNFQWGALYWGNSPDSLSGYYDSPPWDADDLAGVLSPGPDGYPQGWTSQAERGVLYRIELRSPENELLRQIPKWIATSTYKVELNQASQFRFKVPASEDYVSQLTRTNFIWLRDKSGFLLEIFLIKSLYKIGNGEEAWYEVSCMGRLGQLSDPVLEYDMEYVEGVPQPITVGEHLINLLAFQKQDYAIGLGFVDDEILNYSLSYSANDVSILSAIRGIQDVLPKALAGALYITAQAELCWRKSIGSSTTQQFIVGYNLTGVRVGINYDDLITRVYMYGEGNDPAHRLSLIDAGEENEYIQDDDAVATYGIVPLVKQDKRIKHPETLLLFAQRILEEFAEPKAEVEVDVLDLAKADSVTGWENLYAGSTYRVVHTALNVDTYVVVRRVEYNLDKSPLPVRVELDNRRQSLEDLFRKLLERMDQPFDPLDYNRYPNVGRYFPTDPGGRNVYRNGDFRLNDGTLQARQGDAWHNISWEGTNTPQPITEQPASLGSTSIFYAREDHDHQGMPWISVEEYTDIGTLAAAQTGTAGTGRADGVIVFCQENKQWYGLADGTITQFLGAVTIGTLDSIPTVGIAVRSYSNRLWVAQPTDTVWKVFDDYTDASGAPS